MKRSTMKRMARAGIYVVAALSFASSAAMAQTPAQGIAVELNDATPNGPACRLSFVVSNGDAASIDDMAMELVLFDRTGRVDRFIVARTGKVPAGRSRVRQFDMAGADCGTI